MNKHYSYDEDHQMPEPTAEERERQEGKRVLLVLFALLILTALLGIANAQAQSVTAEASVSWTLPTTDTLEQPLIGENALTKVQLFVSTSPITDDSTVIPIELPPVAQSFAYQQAVPNGTTLYFRVKACNAMCSAFSNETTKAVHVSVPGVPTGVTVTLRVNLAVE